LYRTFNIIRSGTFEQDVKTYFSSSDFKKDYENKKWKGNINAIINGAPVQLGANSDNTSLSQFQQQVINSSSFQLSQSFYDYSAISVPDIELAQKYNECLQGQKFGFKLFPDIKEKDAVFVVNYTREFNTDPMPKVTLFSVLNGTVKMGQLTSGQVISNNNTIICERDVNKDLIFILETDKGVITYTVPAEPTGFNRDLPVGTIICSYLNFDQFSAVTDNNVKSPGNTYISKYSKWAPADGRAVPNSQFALITSQNLLPDLRGVFIRGLNQFDANSPVPTDNQKNDPVANRIVGSYQADELKEHKHQFTTNSDANGNGPAPDVPLTFARQGKEKRETDNTGASETRPKNVSLYYYIRIN
jgi:hypothetical protein